MRRSRYLRVTVKNVLFLFCIFATALPSQDGSSFRSNVDLVLAPCTVVDRNGIAVVDITRDEFQVYDNDVRRRIENLWVDADLPLTLGVLVDSSESQKDQFEEHRRTVLEVLRKVLKAGDRSFVISIDEDVRLPVDLTDSALDGIERLAANRGDLFGEPCPKHQSAFPGMRPWSTCGSSPIWDAINDAARIKLKPLSGTKTLLILTDGFDSGSSHTWNQAADAVNKAGASVYVIQYRSASGNHFAPDLNQFILATGGTRFSAPDGDYRQIVSRLETDLRHRYVLGFRPEQLSNKVKHEIRIEVTRPGLTVRARRTYFRDQH
jgi:VWFA-related protein